MIEVTGSVSRTQHGNDNTQIIDVACQIAPMFSVSTWSTLACVFVIAYPVFVVCCRERGYKFKKI
jgi:hypothetical protein